MRRSFRRIRSLHRQLQAATLVGLEDLHAYADELSSMNQAPTSLDGSQDLSSHPLFRLQAIEHIKARQYGTVILAKATFDQDLVSSGK
ncbi:hypothetical protein [Massilia litorea]|uniref:Uncharacterized protein n=1 Tax=Massilia litorea TaxID=2769491 RepID=A0A7L9TZD2_9BURK|nr:hypothetical protein [Massilia litorea]QOL47967.1 hypothetical protein LPB04_13150 [Massilia litorea]